MQRSGSVTNPNPVSQVWQTHADEHTQPRDSYANEGPTINTLTGYTPVRQVKTEQAGEDYKMVTGDKIEPLPMNQTVNLQNVSNNHFSIILQSPHHHAAASQLLDNYTRDFQRKLVNQSATIQPKLTNQTASQQVPTSQMGTFQHTPTHQTADTPLPELLQSAVIQETAHEDTICETGDTQQDLIEQSGTTQQVTSQTPLSEAGITSTVPNQTSTPQPATVSPPQVTVPPVSPLQALEVSPNHTEATETLPTPPQITVPLPSPLETQQAPPNPPQVIGGRPISPQTTVSPTSTLQATQSQPNLPQTPQTPPEFKEASGNQTDILQRAAVNQTEIWQENTLNQTNNVQVFTNQSGTSPGNTSNLTNTTQIPSVTGTGTPPSFEHAKEKSQPRRRKRNRGRNFTNVTKRSALKKVSKSCPCAGKVIQRMATCKKPCNRNDDLLLKLLYVALVILVVYVLFLVYIHHWFRRWTL
ncbi:mucin-7-like [Portunus trituberculatus]|uniref:mucin-7-like n=1 Tax=Portunus trituberculatus TaxID=210409 RepID=UPI001E1D0BCD|nr:mucin-7-like [Portunus trituberculatus]